MFPFRGSTQTVVGFDVHTDPQFLTPTILYTLIVLTLHPPLTLGHFDFPKFSLIFAPGVSIILFRIYKDLGEVSGLKNKNCLDAKKVILYSKNANISEKSRFYVIKQAILHPDSF